MKNGLYRVCWRNVCAGFVIHNGTVVACAPILKRKLHTFWYKLGVWIAP